MTGAGAGHLAQPLSRVLCGALVSGLRLSPPLPPELPAEEGPWGMTEGLASNPASLQMSSSDCVCRGSRCCPPILAPSLVFLALGPTVWVLALGRRRTAPMAPVGVVFPAWALAMPTLVRPGTWEEGPKTWGRGSRPQREGQGFGEWGSWPGQ